jgi:hypothetical protein
MHIRNLLAFFICLLFHSSYAQFIFPESFIMMPLDTSKKYAGTISGAFSQQTQEFVVTQLNSRIELAKRIQSVNVFTVAGNFQVVKNGPETVLSGGYVFARYRDRINRKVFPEYMLQYQWLEARGLEQKIASTANMRYRFIRTESLSLAAACGLLLEYEKWNFSAVRENDLPAETNDIEVYNPRFNSYISYDHDLGDRMNIDMAVYYQFRLDEKLSRKRLGMHSRLNIKLTNKLNYAVTIRLMDDMQPIVPVDPLWYNFSNELVLVF